MTDRSRDPRARSAELLTAYVDGVAELSIEERRRIEATLADDLDARAEQAEVRTMLDQLRALPSEGAEPDWAAMERSIGRAVDDAEPRRWWRDWRWLAPITSCLTAATAVLVMWSRPVPMASSVFDASVREDGDAQLPNGIARGSQDELDSDSVLPLWLDGTAVHVDVALSERALDDDGDDLLDGDDGAEDGDGGIDAMLPSTDLAWVDQLDDDSLELAERFLVRLAERR